MASPSSVPDPRSEAGAGASSSSAPTAAAPQHPTHSPSSRSRSHSPSPASPSVSSIPTSALRTETISSNSGRRQRETQRRTSPGGPEEEGEREGLVPPGEEGAVAGERGASSPSSSRSLSRTPGSGSRSTLGRLLDLLQITRARLLEVTNSGSSLLTSTLRLILGNLLNLLQVVRARLRRVWSATSTAFARDGSLGRLVQLARPFIELLALSFVALKAIEGLQAGREAWKAAADGAIRGRQAAPAAQVVVSTSRAVGSQIWTRSVIAAAGDGQGMPSVGSS